MKALVVILAVAVVLGGCGDSSTTRTESTDSTKTTPFAYDSQNYKWLRGVVNYEKTDRHWSLVYSDAPDAADELSGCVTIGDQPELMGIGDGEIILVTGEFSGTDTDPRGKPIYVVKEITRHGKANLVSER